MPAMFPHPHPVPESAPRKFRRFLGLVMNAETCLEAGGYDLRAAYEYAVTEHDRIASLLAQTAPDDDREAEGQRHEVILEAESELCQRTGAVLDLIQAIEPSHPALPSMRIFLSRWNMELLREQSPAPSSASDVGVHGRDGKAAHEAATGSVSRERLNMLHARLGAMELPHPTAAGFIAFLCGLYHAWQCEQVEASAFGSSSDAALMNAATTSLGKAVEFALQEQSQALIERHASIPGDKEFHALFMGMAYVTQNPPPEAGTWLRSGSPRENLQRLLFTMGVLSCTDPQARRLTMKITGKLRSLIREAFGETVENLVAGYC